MRISPKLLAFEILAFLVFALLAAAGFLAWRLSQGPINLELIRTQVERSLAEARGGQPVKISSLVLEWEGERGRVEAAARELTAYDKGGKVVFSADRAAIALDAGALLSGKFKTRRMRLEDGQASVVRSKDGVWSLADVVLLREPASDKPFDPFKDLKWETLATPVRALVSAGSFERVELENFNLDVDDRKAGTKWGANPVRGVWSAGKDGVTLDLDMKLVGQLEPNNVKIALAADGAVSRAVGQLSLEGVDPLTVGRMVGYGGDAFTSGRPANASFKVEASEKAGLQSTRLTMSGVTGHVKLGEADVTIRSLALDAVYDPATKKIALESLNIASDRATGEFSGVFDVSSQIAGAATGPTPFTLSGRNFSLGLMPTFETAWPFATADITGVLDVGASKLSVSSLKARTGELDVTASGEAWLDGPPEARLVGVKVKAFGEGAITPQQVVAFWPVNLGSGGRTWVRDHIPTAKGGKAVFTVDWPPGANSKGFLPNEHLTLDWEVTGASVKFLDDFPPVTGVTGKGHLEGNRLSMEVTGGKLGTWIVDEGTVSLPQFHPKGAMMEIDVSGHGDLRGMMRILDASNLKVGSKYGLMVEEMVGAGFGNVHVQRPMLEVVPDEALEYTISGGFRDAGAPGLVGGFGLSDADVTYQVTRKDISFTGAGVFGPAPVVFDWKERFADDKGAGGDTLLTASAKATPDLLNAFGIAARNIMQGEAAVELRASAPGGRDFSEITANLDFTHAQLELAEFGWSKKYDAEAKGMFRYGKDDRGAVVTGDIRADGLELIGEARMDKASALQSAEIERIFSRDSVDLRGSLTRRADGGYKVALAGPYFDASPWMDQMLSLSGEGREAENGAGGPAAASGPTIDLQLNADRLKLREAQTVTAAKVALELDDHGPRTGKITANIDGQKKVDVTIKSTGDKRNVKILSDDAGFASQVLLKLDYLEGGKLVLDGDFGPDGGAANVTITDARLKDAPLVAQIFSLASLRGLSDVLSGDGVLFTRIEAPVRISDGRIDLPGLRASGPAMGLTARGWISAKEKELSLDGVLVPSFGVNSVLGGLPIIGDLFVSRQGEGMFAPTYSVRGTFEKAQVSLNPIAAITPGVLRRIFENPSEAPPVADAAPSQPSSRN